MNATGRIVPRDGIVRAARTLALVATLVSVVMAAASAQTGHRSFSTPEEAVQALFAAAKARSVDQLLQLFGPDSQDLVAASDPQTARTNLEVFAVAAREAWRLEPNGDDRRTLVIGYEDWPFPIQLQKTASGWQFDTAGGKEEIVARRIGANELGAIETCYAYVTAQRRYAETAHDAQPAGLYAMVFRSSPGKQNGLYWPASHGEKRSPLGDLVAGSSLEGRPASASPEQRSPYRGYYFKILTAQSGSAAGGAKNYVRNGQMSGGFALVAWPAQYNQTGVMTFLVNQDGVVYEKDLGPETDAAARRMTAYAPDASWQRAE